MDTALASAAILWRLIEECARPGHVLFLGGIAQALALLKYWFRVVITSLPATFVEQTAE
jgi:hypothetical protein